MNKITGTVITLNNEKTIKECIQSLKNICDEIIVVDSISKDQTCELAKNMGAKVIEQPFLGDGPQKIFASEFAVNKWVFSLDADEKLEDDLIRFVKSLDLDNSNYDGYSFKRRNYCGNRWIKAAGFYPDRVIRLYNKKITNYVDRTSHSYIPVKSEFKSDYHITHHTYTSYKEWIDKINFYSSESAKTLHSEGVKASRIRPITHAFFALFKKLFLKGGIFQGLDGITVAITTMFNTYMKYVKLNELYDNNVDPKTHFPKKKLNSK
ncbi:MAG: glycosyl transferase [Gammaproteobacteria bacterium]|nr:glycosyl transferase [Gammaproteobacteria bacterium]|tara:strand:- start:22128 stop:22922 length:795 start_codon:yes stop_codon:yes gene_type:complete